MDYDNKVAQWIYDGSGSKKRKKGQSKKIYYSKRVSFVSIGLFMPNQEIGPKSKEDNDEMGEDDEKSAGLGIGFGSPSSKKANEDEDFLPSPSGKMIREGAKLREEKEKEKAESSQCSKWESYPNGFGEFEKHTKGVGMEMLKKMGYRGRGLGKNEQGIRDPLEIKQWPRKRGIGSNNCKEAARPAMQELVKKIAPRSSESLEGRTKDKLWSKKASEKKAYVTAEELPARKEDKCFELVQTVLDMRGPQVRLLTNLKNLNAEETARENDVPMPELQHNIQLIVDIVEHDIQKLDSNLRNERETVVALQKEKEKLQMEAHDQKQQLGNMEEIMSVLDQISEKHTSGLLTLEALAKSFVDLQTRFSDEYTLCNLSCIACSYALPLFIRIFQGWDPLLNPTHGLGVVSLWKKLLQGQGSFSFSSTASPYMQLLMEVVFPAVRISGTNSWQARDAEPMLRFLESWENLLPPVLQNVLDTVVMPKISAAVDSWDPRKESIPIHSWIHPWLPFLGIKLENCFHTIHNRLSSVLRAWHPSDESAFLILSPWKTVFDPASWEQLMVRYIIPKLLIVMHELDINPANQNLDRFNWVRTWVTAIPPHHMLQLMDIFFNKWQEVLYHWLCLNPDFEEVTKWFLGWKELIPPELQANERVRRRLFLGLEMMEQAVEGMEVAPPGLKENISYLRVSEQRQHEALKKAAAQAQHRATPSLVNEIPTGGISGGNGMSLKEVAEIHAQQNGLLFKPKPGRMQDGHQIYGYGNISIIIDSLNQKIYAQTEDRWTSVSLDQLLELQNRSKMKRH